MFNFFSKHLNGIHLKHNKNTEQQKAVSMPLPDVVILPMSQHMGAPCNPVVKIGDIVKAGQLIGESTAFLSVPIFSSVAGKVTEIRDVVTAYSGVCKAVVIAVDKEATETAEFEPVAVNTQADLIEAAKNCGLVGLGGAGFPTHIKLNPRNLDEVTTLVVNGAECEPYITCDARAMMDDTDMLLGGIDIVKKMLKLDTAIIGVEENKPEAIKILQNACSKMDGVSVKSLRAVYPQGAEKVLIYECTGKVVQEGKLPSDIGVVVMNVTTLIKLFNYIKTGEPLIKRTLTVDGDAVEKPCNVTVPIGTKISDVIEFCGGYKKEVKKLLMGGPMMGIVVPSDDYPVVRNNNAILAFSQDNVENEPETACIRCGSCVRACPMDLLPAALDSAYRHKATEKLEALKVGLCMECGCCAYVCPAKRTIPTSNRLGKQLLREQKK